MEDIRGRSRSSGKRDGTYSTMNLEIKYSSSTYSWLCFRHAVQEAMRSEKIGSAIINQGSDDYFEKGYCELCTIENSAEENARIEWYDNFVETTKNFTPKQPTEEELREEATKLRSRRKGSG